MYNFSVLTAKFTYNLAITTAKFIENIHNFQVFSNSKGRQVASLCYCFLGMIGYGLTSTFCDGWSPTFTI
jgi:hypothetical protein